jgi:hypothetical protein
VKRITSHTREEGIEELKIFFNQKSEGEEDMGDRNEIAR